MSVPQTVGYQTPAAGESSATGANRSSDPTAPSIGHAQFLGLSKPTWIKIGILSLLFCATFRQNLIRLWEKTNPINGEPNWGHAIMIPFIGLYYLYVNRDELIGAPRRHSWLGLAILLWGLAVSAWGIYPGKNDFIKDFGMVAALFGLVAMQAGWKVMKVAWFPIIYLFCGIPWPGLFYSEVASPLQRLAAHVAVDVLQMTRVTAYAGGTKIFVYGQNDVLRTLNVAEACAGLRSLMTFVTVAAAVAFLSARPLWQKLLITASAIPIAIAGNVARVSGQGLLDHYWSQEVSENFAHQFVGLVMLIPAFLLILALGWLLDQIFVDEADVTQENLMVVRRGAVTSVQSAPPPAPNPLSKPSPPVVPPPPPPAGKRPLGFSPRGTPPAPRHDERGPL